jgi:hypothetical protein
MQLRNRYKIGIAAILYLMFGPGVVTILALVKYLDRVAPSELAQDTPQGD